MDYRWQKAGCAKSTIEFDEQWRAAHVTALQRRRRWWRWSDTTDYRASQWKRVYSATTSILMRPVQWVPMAVSRRSTAGHVSALSRPRKLGTAALRSQSTSCKGSTKQGGRKKLRSAAGGSSARSGPAALACTKCLPAQDLGYASMVTGQIANLSYLLHSMPLSPIMGA